MQPTLPSLKAAFVEELESVQLTSVEASSLQSPAAHQADYLILDRRVRLAGNDAAILDRFTNLYGAFRADVVGSPDLLIRYHLDAKGSLVVSGPAENYRSAAPEVIQWPSVLMARMILRELVTHWMIHAACVSRDGKAVVLAGGSGMGKTTLAAHLGAKGFALLSDEFAPISRSDGFVEPFPLRIGIREGPGRALIQSMPAIDLNFQQDAKKLVDLSLMSGSPATRALLHAVVFLTTKVTANVTTVHKRDAYLKAWFTGWSPVMEREIVAETGARILSVKTDLDLLEVDMELEDLAKHTEPLRAIARRHGTLLAQIKYEDHEPIDRSADSVCMRIPAAAGVMELIKKIPSSSRTALLERVHGGKASGLIADMSARLKDVEFYKMVPGRLDSSIAHVEEMLK